MIEFMKSMGLMKTGGILLLASDPSPIRTLPGVFASIGPVYSSSMHILK